MELWGHEGRTRPYRPFGSLATSCTHTTDNSKGESSEVPAVKCYSRNLCLCKAPTRTCCVGVVSVDEPLLVVRTPSMPLMSAVDEAASATHPVRLVPPALDSQGGCAAQSSEITTTPDRLPERGLDEHHAQDAGQ